MLEMLTRVPIARAHTHACTPVREAGHLLLALLTAQRSILHSLICFTPRLPASTPDRLSHSLGQRSGQVGGSLLPPPPLPVRKAAESGKNMGEDC